MRTILCRLGSRGVSRSSFNLTTAPFHCAAHQYFNTLHSSLTFSTIHLPVKTRRCFAAIANDISSENSPAGENSIMGGSEELAQVSGAEVIEELKKSVTELESQLMTTEGKCKDLQDRLLRALAENENSRERYRKEIENTKQFAIHKFAESILEVADNLQRAVEASSTNENNNQRSVESTALLDGVKMIQKVLSSSLENFGIKPFEAIGEPFNPKLHEALFEMNHPDQPKGTVVQVLKQGYMINDRVLRAAKVGTSKGPIA